MIKLKRKLILISLAIFIMSWSSVFAEDNEPTPTMPANYENEPLPPFAMPNMPPGVMGQYPPGFAPVERPEEGVMQEPEFLAPSVEEEIPAVKEEAEYPEKKPLSFPTARPMEAVTKKETISRTESASLKTPVEKAEQPDKVSLDLKGVDIVDVLKMFSSRSNLNIVVGKNVRGKVTIFLNNVDLWDAFEIILASNELAYDRRGDIINVMTERDYELLYGEKYNSKTKIKIIKLEYAKASDVAKFLNQIKSRVGKIISDDISNTIVLIDSPVTVLEMDDMVSKLDAPTETKVFSLNYAKAEDLKVKINELLTKGSGILQVDERTNKIVVTDTVKKLEDISKVIAAFDEKHKEVLIEAEILEVLLSDEYKAGIDWEKLLQRYHGLSLKSIFNLQAAGLGGPLGELAIGSLTTDGYTVLLQLLETIGKTKTLSRPRITALNNQEAKILVGTKQPYTTETVVTPATGASTTATNVTFVDVGIKLYVTPTINQEGFVTMKIKPEVSSASTTPYTTTASVKIPIVSTSEAETTIMVKDGTTIVIGGLMKDIDSKSINQLPFLGDIPFFGNLFKKVDNTVTKSEIVIFLTPHIITGDREVTHLTGLDDKVKMNINNKPYHQEKVVRLTKQPPAKPVVEGLEKNKVKQPKVIEKSVIKEISKIVTKEIPIPSQTGFLRTGSSYGYYDFVRSKVLRYARINPPEEDIKGDVKVSFTVDSSGDLEGEPVILDATNRRLNNFAKKNIIDASPFPPFPQGMKKDSQSFVLTISYE